MIKIQPPFDVIMVWYQNDWGLYGRRNEFIARTLLRHRAVRKVLHIEPPIDLEHLNSRLCSDSLDDNVHMNLKRINLYNDKGVFLYTPHILEKLSRDMQLESLHIQIEKVIDLCGINNILLWLYPPHPFADFALNFFKDRASLIASDCVDDHRQYAKTEAERLLIESRYKRIVGTSDIVFCVSKAMRDEMAQHNPHAFYIPNAIPSDLFTGQKVGSEPAGMAGVKHPVIGYTGALSLRIDAELLRFVAESRPDWNIVLIGTSPNSDVQALFEMPNVHWLGSVRYEDIHAYISQFDVCILPHAVNSMTDNMNPLKVFEYLALGKPVVSTDVAGVRMFQGDIEIARSSEEFIEAIEKSLAENSPEREKKRINRVRNHTWTDRIDEMMRLSLNALKAKTSAEVPANKKQYYSFERPEVCACVPGTAKTILDVGCASGRLGAALKKRQDCVVVGVEYEPEIANEARYLLDDVIVGDIEEKVGTLPSDYFDCIVLADVLEHLRSPEAVLQKLSRTLKDTGTIVASIPNVRHWSVLRPLLEGDWNYEDAGILDRTHLRFFTRKSIQKLFADCGYTIREFMYTTVGEPSAFLQPISKILSLSGIDARTLAEEANHYQYIVTAEKALRPHKLTSIIILTFNQLEYTKKCMESIQEHTPEPHEIIVVDNGSTDGTREYLIKLAQDRSEIQLILNDRNRGFAAGNNQALEKAKGDYILLLNNDVVVTQGWLGTMIEHLNNTPDAGMVGPMSNSVSGPQLVKDVPYGDSLDDMQAFARDFASENRGKTIEHMRLVGFCLLIRKEVIDIIGRLDENYLSGNFEDDDLCLRSSIAGYKNIIARDVFVHHFGSMTFKGNSIDYQSTMKNNFRYFSDKWKGFIETGDNQYRVRLTREQQIETLLTWGEDKFSQGDVQAAEKIFKRILHIDRSNSQALNNLGVIQWQCGEVASAMDFFQNALAANPKDPDALANLLQAARETERFDLIDPKLLDVLKQAQPANPDIVKIMQEQQGIQNGL